MQRLHHLMTGVSWGGYQDYLYGRFDGEEDLDDAQMDWNGNRVSHGGHVYYMVPTKSFTEYIMKPPSEKVHEKLVKWVSEGGTLIYVDDWMATAQISVPASFLSRILRKMLLS